MNQMGLCENVVRLPLAPVNQATENRLKELMSQF
jgi:hypothetical protein